MTGARALAIKAKNDQLYNNAMFTEYLSEEKKNKELTSGSKRGQVSTCYRLTRYLLWLVISKILLVSFFYYFPIPPFEPTNSNHQIEAPSFVGRLAANDDLDKAEVLFEGSIRSPEASADDLSGNFFTGVEGGFILYVDSRRNISTMVAMLNSNSTIYGANLGDHIDPPDTSYNYCDLDVHHYGERAEYVPNSIVISRCSRPLGLRLSPDERYLYVVDPFKGLFRVDLTKWDSSQNVHDHNNRVEVTLLIDSKKRHKSLEQTNNARIVFLDDLVVDWYKGPTGGDIIYMTDASSKWTVREFMFAFMEHDTTGRILRFDTNTKQLSTLDTMTPVRYTRQAHSSNDDPTDTSDYILDYERKLTFPNGLALMDKSQALLINDIGNARILKHYIDGPEVGRTYLWASVPGWPDNIKRGADVDRETYWVACGCAISDASQFDINMYLLNHPTLVRILFKFTSLFGRLIEYIGDNIIRSVSVTDTGHSMRNMWLVNNRICQRGIIVQYDNNGSILRSLQTTKSDSKWKFISEAREILMPIEETPKDNLSESLELLQPTTMETTEVSKTTLEPQTRTIKRYLYLFSAVYSYLGRVDLGWL